MAGTERAIRWGCGGRPPRPRETAQGGRLSLVLRLAPFAIASHAKRLRNARFRFDGGAPLRLSGPVLSRQFRFRVAKQGAADPQQGKRHPDDACLVRENDETARREKPT